jgi:hypothetical protein
MGSVVVSILGIRIDSAIMRQLGLSVGEEFVTEDHPFLTSQGWKSFNPEMTNKLYPYLGEFNIGKLDLGDNLKSLNGDLIKVEKIKRVLADPNTQLYSLVVDGDKTYNVNDFIVLDDTN